MFKWEQLDHLPNSPDMSPCDFHVFGLLKNIWKGSASTRTMNSRTLWRTWPYHDHKNSGSTEPFGSLMNGIILLRPMVHTLNKVFFYAHSDISYPFIWTLIVYDPIEISYLHRLLSRVLTNLEFEFIEQTVRFVCLTWLSSCKSSLKEQRALAEV